MHKLPPRTANQICTPSIATFSLCQVTQVRRAQQHWCKSHQKQEGKHRMTTITINKYMRNDLVGKELSMLCWGGGPLDTTTPSWNAALPFAIACQASTPVQANVHVLPSSCEHPPPIQPIQRGTMSDKRATQGNGGKACRAAQPHRWLRSEAFEPATVKLSPTAKTNLPKRSSQDYNASPPPLHNGALGAGIAAGLLLPRPWILRATCKCIGAAAEESR